MTHSLFIFLLLALPMTFTPTASAQDNPVSVSLQIDAAKRHQAIEGFGASGCWTAQLTGDWPKASQEKALDLLFTDEGAALSIWRYNIGSGGGEEISDLSRRAISVEVEPGRYDLSRDKAALDVVRGAVERGVERVVCFAISFPERFTVSGKVSGGEQGEPNLRPGLEKEAAKYIADITLRLKQELRLKEVRLSPMNEPQWQWGGKAGRRQEGCHMLPDQLAKLSGECARLLQTSDPSILIEGPEGGAWGGATFSYVEAYTKDPVLMKQLGLLAIHSYWSNDDARREFMQKYRDAGLTVPIAQTEWCDMQWGRDEGMPGAFTLYRTMHSDLTVCNVVSWTFWLAMSNYDYRDGLIYIEKDNTLTPAKRLYVMGHFSRFLRPGAVRVEATASDEKLLATSYFTKHGAQLVTVLGNPTDQEIRLSISTGDLKVERKGKIYITDERRDMVEGDADMHSVNLPPQSIVTLVGNVVREKV